MCKKCSLVQLNRSFNLRYLYGPDYGYKTGINKTMRDHMDSIRSTLSKKSKLTFPHRALWVYTIFDVEAESQDFTKKTPLRPDF